MAESLRVLVVDDQLDSVASLASALEGMGHRVELTADPMEALRLLASTMNSRAPFGLVICDINMPALDGPGLVRELRRRGDKVPAIFITGYASVANRIRGELASLEVLGLLTKPLAIAELERLIAGASKRNSTQGMGKPGAPAHPLEAGEFDDDAPFYGTSRTFGRTPSPKAPTEGILSRVKPPSEAAIIPDDIIGAGPPLPQRGMGGIRTPSSGNPIRRIPSEKPTPRQETSGGFPISDEEPMPGTPSFRRHGDLPASGPPIQGFRDPVTGNMRRTPSPAESPEHRPLPRIPTPAPPGETAEGTTARFRRTLGGGTQSQPQTGSTTGAPSVPTSLTTRIRRGLGQPPGTGSGSGDALVPNRPPPAQPASFTVACAHCAAHFTVLAKSESYTVHCMHCGQLNRIDPL